MERNTEEDLHCIPAVHTRCRSLLEQINWLQSRTKCQCCYKFSRSASKAASPTIGDVKVLNKLARQLKSQPLKLQLWPLTVPLRRCMTVFSAESRELSSKDGMSYGNLIDYESQRIKRIVLSTAVAELYSFMKCFGSCQFLRGLWMNISGEIADIHMRIHAQNVVTTATTIHLPEPKRNHPHDFYVSKGSLFRKYSWSCSYSNSELFGRLPDDGISKGR